MTVATPEAATTELQKQDPIYGAFLFEPAEVYHAKARDYLSSHQLADFRKCPLLYYQKHYRLVPDEDRPAYIMGRAAHTLILEGVVRFNNCYAVGGPINPKTGQPFGANTKAFAEWAVAIGKEVLTDSQYNLIRAMAESVWSHEVAQTLLADGLPEAVLRRNYCGVPCQIRMDWYDAVFGLVDLKTCDDLTWFESDARRFEYAHQLAFYRAVLAQAIGVYVPVHLIAVEKKAPYRTGVWRVSQETLGLAQKANEAAIEHLKCCQDSESWPTGYEQPRIFDHVV